MEWTLKTVGIIGGGIAAIVILFWTWRNSDEDTRSRLINTAKKYAIPFIIFLFYLYFRNDWGFVSESWLGEKKSADVFLFFALIVWQLGVLFLGKERYEATQAICDNRHGSCFKYEERGDYVVLNIGSLASDYFSWIWGHETWVVRKDSFSHIGDQIYSGTQIDKVDAIEVPAEVYDFIINTPGYNKINVYYGEFSQAAKIKDPEKTELETKLKDTNRLLNENRIMLKGKTSAIKAFVSDTSLIQKKARGENLLGGYSGGEQGP